MTSNGNFPYFSGVVFQSGTTNCMDTCVLLKWCGYVSPSLHPWTNEEAVPWFPKTIFLNLGMSYHHLDPTLDTK